MKHGYENLEIDIADLLNGLAEMLNDHFVNLAADNSVFKQKNALVLLAVMLHG